MSLTRRIAHNTIIQIAGKLVSTAIGIIVVGMLTRHLGTSGYGEYTTIIAFLQFFAILLDLGLYIVLIKKISEPNAPVDSLVSNAFTLRIVSAIIILGLAPVVAMAFPYPGVVKIGIAITSLSYLFISLTQILAGVFQKALHMELVSIAELAGRVALFGGTIAVIMMGWDLYAVLLTVVTGSFINFLLTFVFVRRFVSLRLTFHMGVWRDILRDSWPIAISVVLNLMYFKADTVILSLVRPAADVGIYGATYKVLEILVTFPAMFAGLLMPLLSAAFAQGDSERFRRITQRGFDFLLMIGVPMAVGTQFVATSIMTSIADESFRASGDVLRILIVATAIIFVGSLFGNAVVAVNKQRAMIWRYLVVAIISVAGYLIFIPRFSYIGAAWMTLVSEGLITLTAFFMVRRAVHPFIRFATAGRVILASALMAGVLFLIRDLHWAIILLTGVVVYAIFLFALRGVSRETIREIVRLR